MILSGERVTAPRMLLLNQVDVVRSCAVFALEQPLFLNAGDELWFEDGEVVVQRVSGRLERPAGDLTPTPT